jgi:predicted O-methyltransferase YrrM
VSQLKELLRRWTPQSIKRFAPRSLRRNPSWSALAKRANARLMPVPSHEAREACLAIREAYKPLLERHGVDYRQFWEGSIKAQDASTLYTMVRQRSPLSVFQVGTFAGYSAMVLAHALRANGRGRIVCCDPEIPHRTLFNPVDMAREAAALLGLEEQVEFVRGFHAIKPGSISFPRAWLREVPVSGRPTLERIGTVDFAFIDGDHSTVSTISDLMLLEEFLAESGVIVFHDAYSWPTVTRALEVFFEDIYYWGSETAKEFRLDLRFGPDGLAAIERLPRREYGLLRIRVHAADDDSPIPRARVEVPSRGLDALAGDDGVVYLFGGAEEGARVQASAPGFRSSEVVTLSPSWTDTLESKLLLERSREEAP